MGRLNQHAGDEFNVYCPPLRENDFWAVAQTSLVSKRVVAGINCARACLLFKSFLPKKLIAIKSQNELVCIAVDKFQFYMLYRFIILSIVFSILL